MADGSMGNVLCKQPNPSSPPAATPTGNGSFTSNLSSIICPNGIGIGKGKAQPMRKTYFTRSAVDASKKTSAGHTTSTGWQSVGLHVPDGPTRPVTEQPPVAPPRKKRGSTLDGRYRSDESLKVKNGFQDVFGRESRRHSCDVTPGGRPSSVPPPRPEAPALPARQTSCFEIDASNDAFSDFSKVPTTAELEKPTTSQIPRVGNRKSDRFFGEQLADSLSPESDALATAASGSNAGPKKKSIPKDDVDKIEAFVERETSVPRVVVVEANHTSEKQTVANNISKGQPPKDAAKKESDMVSKATGKPKPRDEVMNRQIGSRAEFMMAMLTDYSDSVRYEGMKPIEEPLIVPKRRKSRHICDDHDHLHKKLHEHEREEPKANVILTEASIEVAPRKPSRDFTKYKPLDDKDEAMANRSPGDSDGSESIVRPVRTKQKSKQRESLPTPPAPPKFQKSHSESKFDRQLSKDSADTPAPGPVDDGPKAHSPRTLKRIISMPVTENLNKETLPRPDTPQRPTLSKSSSSGSFSTVDLQRSRICVERFTPEDYAHHTVMDELVTPKSKLMTRKISWKSLETPVPNRTPTPTFEPPAANNAASFTIGGTEVVTSASVVQPPEVPTRRRSDASTVGESSSAIDHSKNSVEPEDSTLRKFCLGSFIESSNVLQHHDVVNVLDRVYSASDNKENIIEQFQAFLEEHLNAELNDPHPVNPNVAKLREKLSNTSSSSVGSGASDKLENVQIELVGSSASSSNKSSEVDDCFDPEFEKIEKSELTDTPPKVDAIPPHVYNNRRRDSIEYMNEWFGTESVGGSPVVLEATEEEVEPPTEKLTPDGGTRKRIESIEDVGSWFSRHNVLRPSFGQEFEEPDRRLRRGSDGFLGYDLQRQYPFGKGRERSDSLSAEMFEDITKLHERLAATNDGTHSLERKPLRVIPPHVKVLNTPHRGNSHNNSAHGSAEKLTNNNEIKSLPAVSGKPGEVVTTTHEELKPLLESDASKATADNATNERTNVSQSAIDVPAVEEATGQQHPYEHSTLLKFLSKERLVE
ncbi:uncharacterized protein LOC131215708 [Anopheles bellator]|uniref:uncharacterized protein LOC131215708 n=1 Tax=Anopheles bellator TaxID=139047 RepID=UPI00264A26CA|nr:uncharacterized protein LOC131215708 [Anopheles bellator]